MIFLNLEYVVVALLLGLSSIGQNLIVNPFCFLDSLLPDSLLCCFSSSLLSDSLLSLTNSSLLVLSGPNSSAQFAVSLSRQFEVKSGLKAPRTKKKFWRKFFRPEAKTRKTTKTKGKWSGNRRERKKKKKKNQKKRKRES
jgi:hypothetical protein